jgi:hypothetical protein
MATVTSEELLKQILAASSNLPQSASNKVQRPLASADFRWKPTDEETKKDVERAKLADAEIRKAAQATTAPSKKDSSPEPKAPKLKQLNAEELKKQDLAGMEFHQIYQMRKGQSPEVQALLGPYEHRALVREAMETDPVRSSLFYSAAIPAYTIAKAIGAIDTRSPASLEEMKQAYIGGFEGMGKATGLIKGAPAEQGIKKDSKGKPVNTQFNTDDPEEVARMMQAVTNNTTPPRWLDSQGKKNPNHPDYVAPTGKQLNSEHNEWVRAGQPRRYWTLPEAVAAQRKQSGQLSAEDILKMIGANITPNKRK